MPLSGKSGLGFHAIAQNLKIEELEAVLGRPWYKLRFPPTLEAAYEADRGAARNRAIAGYLVIFLIAKLLLLLANLQIASHVFRAALTLRLSIVLPLTVLSVFLLLQKRVPSWIHGVAAFTPLVSEVALSVTLGRLAAHGFTDRYIFATVIGIFAQTLLMRAPFRQSACGLAVTLAVFFTLCEVSWPGHFGPPVTRDLLIFGFALSFPALYERYTRDKAGRRDFLLHEMNRLRMEDILRMNAHLERLSSLDGLTGVFNRRYLDTALARLCSIAADKRRWIAILMIDIDHFKQLNDTAGHQHGDFCLERVAQLLQTAVRAGVDTVARYGGEEFVAILPDANEQEALAIGERVRQAIEDAGLPAANGRVVTVSAGAAAVQGQRGASLTVEELIAAADEALYQAKRSGRNRVVYTARAMQIA
jgi:diguanylate cyclase (GGDEF)-like protein